jgi:biotin carboxyl carrier protein
MGKTFKIIVNGRPYTVEVGRLSESPIAVRVDGEVFHVDLEKEGYKAATTPDSVTKAAADAGPASSSVAAGNVSPKTPTRATSEVTAASGDKVVTAPMPGVVLVVRVREGDRVKHGQEVCVMESMKMELNIMATCDGVVRKVCVAAGQSVVHGTVLVELV